VIELVIALHSSQHTESSSTYEPLIGTRDPNYQIKIQASEKVDENANRDPEQGTELNMMEVLSRVAENAAEAVDAALRESDDQTGDASSSPSA